jgi:alpha-N-acetylglucosamine transferase
MYGGCFLHQVLELAQGVVKQSIKQTEQMFCVIIVFFRVDYEDCCYLGCDAVWSGRPLTTLQRIFLAIISREQSTFRRNLISRP